MSISETLVHYHTEILNVNFAPRKSVNAGHQSKVGQQQTPTNTHEKNKLALHLQYSNSVSDKNVFL